MNDCLSVCQLLKSASGCCERELNDALAVHDISHCQATILLQIVEGIVTMSLLSKKMCCHKSNITQVVDGLVKKKLLLRSVDKDDKRVQTLLLTNQGKTIAHTLRHTLCTRATQCMDIFSSQEKEQLAMLLTKYIEAHRE